MVPSLALLSCELSLSVKENPDRKKKKKDLLNEGQSLAFYKHVIYINFAMNFKMCGFVGFTEWTCNLDLESLLGHKLGKEEILDSSWELFL